jgi:hypothetical protein
MAKAKLERLEAPRSKWAPGVWAAATAAYKAGTFPEVRCPVIIGGNSMLRTPEDLRDLLKLPSVPPLTQTTETTLFPLPDEKEQGQNKETLDVADVNLKQYFHLQDSTEGDTVVVWFRGERRFAWLPRSRKTEDSATSSGS